jgi:hypothetical protein
MDGNRVQAIRVTPLRNRIPVFTAGDTTSITVPAGTAAQTLRFKEFSEPNRYLQDRYDFDTITLR